MAKLVLSLTRLSFPLVRFRHNPLVFGSRQNLRLLRNQIRSMSFYDITATNIKGQEVSFTKYKDKVVLIENVASLWGSTTRDYTQVCFTSFADEMLPLSVLSSVVNSNSFTPPPAPPSNQDFLLIKCTTAEMLKWTMLEHNLMWPCRLKCIWIEKLFWIIVCPMTCIFHSFEEKVQFWMYRRNILSFLWSILGF